MQIELATRHQAPKVRTTVVFPNFVKTPLLFEGDTGMPGFFAPLLHVDTVGEKIVNALYSTYGTTIYLPGVMRLVASFVRPCVPVVVFKLLTKTDKNRGERPSGC